MIADAETLWGLNQIAETLGFGAFSVSVLRIIGVDIILAGDNAVVIALACRTLPPRQRVAGVVLGTAAAVVMRVLFTIAVSSLLDVPLLALVGGLILFWIAIKLLLAEEQTGEDVDSGATLWEAVKTIAIADAIMSLDNVLAIAGASGGDWSLIVIGLLISIPLVVGGSTLIMAVLHKFPVLVWAGAALLGWIAAELIVREQLIGPWVAEITQHLGASLRAFEYFSAALGAALVMVAGALLKRARASPG